MRKGDFFLLIVVSIIAGTFMLVTNWPLQAEYPTVSGDKTGYDFVVSVDGKDVYRGELIHSETEQYVTIPLNSIRPDYHKPEAVLEIVNGRVRVMPMSLELCPEQICCHVMGWIQRPGHLIVCMPNLMIVRIETTEDVGYDVLAG